MILQFILFFCVFLVINLAFLLPTSLMLNKFFFKKSNKSVILYSILAILIFLTLMIMFRFVSIEFTRIIYYLLGIFTFGMVISVIFWTIYLLLKLFSKTKYLLTKKTIYFILGIWFFLTAISIYNFERGVEVEEFDIYSDKISKNYSFIQISDIQYGTVDVEYMNLVIDLAMEQNPDFIVFTGDLIDFEGYGEEDFKHFESVDVPIYFERGNHEFYHFPDKILSYLNEISTIDVLIDEKVSFEEIDIVGIDFNRSIDNLDIKLEEIELNSSRFSIFLYHEPKGVEFPLEKGFDLLLFGHTHAGQIFPYTLVVDLMYTYSDGYYEVGDSIIYTTDGAALWGPKMRLGSQNEIVKFNLISNK